MVKIVIIEGLGVFIGEYEVHKNNSYCLLKQPLQAVPTQKGTLALKENPVFQNDMKIYMSHVICESDPKKILLDEYEKYAIKKRSGIEIPPSGIIKSV